MIRMDRVREMADWLDTIPPRPSFQQHPDFGQFADLSRDEFAAVGAEMRRRGLAAAAEADALEREWRSRKVVRIH